MAFNDIFKVLKKGPLPKQKEMENIPSFMFCRYLGGHQVTIQSANIFNMYHKEIPVDIQYKLVKSVFAGKNIYPKMLKKIPKETNLDALCKHFKISRDLAKEYRTFLSDEEFKEICKMYEING